MILLADVLALHGPAYLAKFGRLIPPEQRAAVRAIRRCRTPALGGQAYRCTCGQTHFAYHSCRVKGFASRGLFAQGMLSEVMCQLLLQESPASATLKKSLPA